MSSKSQSMSRYESGEPVGTTYPLDHFVGEKQCPSAACLTPINEGTTVWSGGGLLIIACAGCGQHAMFEEKE